MGMQRFLLEVRGYRVLLARDAATAMTQVTGDVDLVLGFPTPAELDWQQIAACMHRAKPDLPIVLVGGGSDVQAADALTFAPRVSTGELLDHVHRLVARRRPSRRNFTHAHASV